VIDVNTDRDLHTRHGLHLNSKGKECSVNQIVKVTDNLLNVSQKKPLVLNWEEEEERDTEYIVNQQEQELQCKLVTCSLFSIDPYSYIEHEDVESVL
jgi:hypothetical protein